jgi:hypothetical protein
MAVTSAWPISMDSAGVQVDDSLRWAQSGLRLKARWDDPDQRELLQAAQRWDIFCHRGHLRTELGTYIEPDGTRHCRTCRKATNGWYLQRMAKRARDRRYRATPQARERARLRQARFRARMASSAAQIEAD